LVRSIVTRGRGRVTADRITADRIRSSVAATALRAAAHRYLAIGDGAGSHKITLHPRARAIFLLDLDAQEDRLVTSRDGEVKRAPRRFTGRQGAKRQRAWRVLTARVDRLAGTRLQGDMIGLDHHASGALVRDRQADLGSFG
jgi:hypothetical protein